ncbi:SMEK domain-containing protein [Marinicellulosiphila megalodicopiae]|uniref:SMEK domain-containing protein n=1 Tax=Marinicellulosiphila megalodicopiae TaxID=2724896 RepID=UPI003BAF6204
MMVQDRIEAFNTISRILAITRLDIEHHQFVNDQCLNIHGENYFRDVFNLVFDRKFENANFGCNNAPYIDLIDTTKKELIQVTTTRSKEKILHSLKALSDKKYKDYNISIYYLLEKSRPKKETIDSILEVYKLDLISILNDSSDLIKSIENLETNRLVNLCELYFRNKSDKYTDHIVLNLTYKKLLKAKNNLPQPSYDEDFNSIEVDPKIKLNKLNERISFEIKKSLDYTTIIKGIDDGNLASDLQEFVIGDLYKNILVEMLSSKEAKSILNRISVTQLHVKASEYNLDFNKIIIRLNNALESLMDVKDFNSMIISWILISYFFEICEVGVKIDDTSK